MKAVVYRGPFSVAVEDVPGPRIEAANDAIVRTSAAATCTCRKAELGLAEAPGAYDKFDKRVDGFTKVLLHPAAA